MSSTILGIESSCDETSASICRDGKVINNIIATQSVHKQFGGVVPELASRAHQKNIVPIIEESLRTASIDLNELSAIAYTQGPGLLGALLVGSSFAKSLAMALEVPLIAVNHMQAHVLSHFIEDPKPSFPFICLTVSGGHTQLVLVEDYLKMRVIGRTLDDAVGEAFDKGAKLLGFAYPGGPLVDQHAKSGDPTKFQFAKSEISGFDYSFSGIKTSLLYFLRKEIQKDSSFVEQNLADIAASYQAALIAMLEEKLVAAATAHEVKHVAIAGGVSANSGLRSRLRELGDVHGWKTYIPKFEYCTDNAGMISLTGYYQFLKQDFAMLDTTPMPRMPLA